MKGDMGYMIIKRRVLLKKRTTGHNGYLFVYFFSFFPFLPSESPYLPDESAEFFASGRVLECRVS